MRGLCLERVVALCVIILFLIPAGATRGQDRPHHLMIGLLVDTSLSQRRALDQGRKVTYTLLDHTMRPDKDKAFLRLFGRAAAVLQPGESR